MDQGGWGLEEKGERGGGWDQHSRQCWPEEGQEGGGSAL
jgi:hypothetical protein